MPRSLLAVLLVLVSSVAAAQEAPPGLAERARFHVAETVEPAAVGGSLLGAALMQWGREPEAWSRDTEGYARRAGAVFAENAVEQGIHFAAGAAAGQDPRYRRRGEGGLWRRSWHAASGVVVATARDGRKAPAWPRWVSAYGSASVADLWYPSERSHGRHVVMAGTASLVGDFASNLWREFWPDVRQRLFR